MDAVKGRIQALEFANRRLFKQNKELIEENKGWLNACNNYAKLIQEVQETSESFRGKNKELTELTKGLEIQARALQDAVIELDEKVSALLNS